MGPSGAPKEYASVYSLPKSKQVRQVLSKRTPRARP